MKNPVQEEKRVLLFVLFALAAGLAIGWVKDNAPQIYRQADFERIMRDAEQAQVVTVNINTASREELTKLPGIGPATAGRIISYRNVNGPFRNAEDLTRIKGIGVQKFAKLKSRIVLK